MVSFFIPYYLCYVLILLLVYVIGFFYINFSTFNNDLETNNSFSFKIGLYSSVGFIILTSTVAVISTKTNTLFLWPFSVLTIYFFQKFDRKKLKRLIKIKGFEIKKFVFFLIIASIIFLYHTLIFENPKQLPFFDFVFMGKISSGLFKEGVETARVFNRNFVDINASMLYHYGDVWLNGLIHSITKLPEVHLIRYTMFPFTHVITFFLSTAIFKKLFKTNTIYSIIGGFGIIYGSLLMLPIEWDFWKLVKTYRGFPNAPFYFKLLPIYIIGLLSYLFYLEKKDFKYLIFLSFIPIFYSTTIPAISGMLIFNILFFFILRKWFKGNKNLTLKETLFPLMSILFILFFITLNPSESIIDIHYHIYPIKTYLVLLFETLFKAFIEHPIVFLLFIFVLFKTKLKNLLRPFTILPLAGIGACFLFVHLHKPGIPDMNQAMTTIIPLLLLLIFLDSTATLSKSFIKPMLVIMLVIGVYNLSYFKINAADHHGITSPKFKSSKQFQINVLNYIKKLDFDFIAGTVSNNYKIKTQLKTNVSRFYNWRWYYDDTNEFRFIMLDPNTYSTIELAPIFENELEPFCSSEINRLVPYPMCDLEINDKTDIVKKIKSKKINHIFFESHKIIDKKIMEELDLIEYDEKSGFSLWKIN